jgi:hypothetical protein
MPQPEGGCAMATWAADFEASAVFDCTGQGPEINPANSAQERVTALAIYRQETVENDPNFVPSPEDTGLVLNEEDDEQTFVYVYGFDEEGNYDYCTTYVQVEAHVSCGGDPNGGNLAGLVLTEDQRGVERVSLSLSGERQAVTNTAVDGSYGFQNLTFGGDYTVTPYRNDDHDNGVTTFDIVKISQHILGTELLDGPYRRIAADVNRTGTVTTLDIIQIRKLILNIDPEFTNNTSWRFVAVGYVFPDIENPWVEEFPELYNVNNLSEVITDADFVAIKVGDVNNSARANSLDDDGRSLNGSSYLELDEQPLRQGNIYTIPVYVRELAQVSGYQGTLQLQDAQLLDIIYGQAQAANFGLQYADQGILTMSWNRDGVEAPAVGAPMCSLVLRATADQPLSEVLSISSRYTPAEAYSLGGVHRDLELTFSTKRAVAGQFELYQNTPNPFREETLVGFYLPRAERVQLVVHDLQGRVVWQSTEDRPAGYQHWSIDSKVWRTSPAGVYQYSVTILNGEGTAGERQSRKMVRLPD